MTAPCYVYGIVSADAAIPEGLRGLDGAVTAVRHRELAAVVSALPRRSLGCRDDLLAHEQVIDTIAATQAMLPMRFAAVLADDGQVVDELLEPHHDELMKSLTELSGRSQFTLRGTYEQDVVLAEIVRENPEILRLRDQIRTADARSSYQLRIRQGELVVQAMGRMRTTDGETIRSALAPHAVSVSAHQAGEPDELVDMAFLVAESQRAKFEQAVEDVGAAFAGRARLRLVGPLPAYDFVPRM